MGNQNIVAYSLPGELKAMLVAEALKTANITDGKLVSGAEALDGKGIFVRRDAALAKNVVFVIADYGRVTGESNRRFTMPEGGYDGAVVITSQGVVSTLGLNGLLNPVFQHDVKRRTDGAPLLDPEKGQKLVQAYHAEVAKLNEKHGEGYVLNHGDAYERMSVAEKIAIFSAPVKVVSTVMLDIPSTETTDGFTRPMYIFTRASAEEIAKLDEAVAKKNTAKKAS